MDWKDWNVAGFLQTVVRICKVPISQAQCHSGPKRHQQLSDAALAPAVAEKDREGLRRPISGGQGGLPLPAGSWNGCGGNQIRQFKAGLALFHTASYHSVTLWLGITAGFGSWALWMVCKGLAGTKFSHCELCLWANLVKMKIWGSCIGLFWTQATEANWFRWIYIYIHTHTHPFSIKMKWGLKCTISGTSLVVQWLGLHAFNVGNTGLIPGGGTRISHDLWPG